MDTLIILIALLFVISINFAIQIRGLKRRYNDVVSAIEVVVEVNNANVDATFAEIERFENEYRNTNTTASDTNTGNI